MAPIKLVVIDDHLVVVKGICDILATCPDITVVGTASTADKGLIEIGNANPDVVIVDVHLPCADRDALSPELCSYGLALVREIHQRLPETGILVLTGLPTPMHMEAAIRAGACGYLDKGCSGREIADAVRKAAQGKPLHDDNDALSPLQQLTDRELEILHLAWQGLTAREIATSLHISTNTVNSHKKKILGKLDAEDSTDGSAVSILRKDHQKMVISNVPISRTMKR